MAKVSPIVASFNAGELSPLMAGRSDLKYYKNACRRIRNFILTPQGPARRRGGTRFVAAVKNSANRTWLAKFEFNVVQAYILEFGDFYVRFFANHGVVGAPLEVATPYAIADLTNSDGTFALRFAQSNDVLYVMHNKYPPQKLVRTGAAAFNIQVPSFVGGPFDDVDDAATVTIYAAANTGATTLTASAPIFLAGHVGSLFYLEQKSGNTTPQWEPGKVVAAAAVRRSDGKNYHTAAGGTTGAVKPVHTIGSAYDGDAGVQWTFDDPGYGWGIITAFTDTTHVNITVLSRFPDMAVGVGNPSLRWAFGSWNSLNGYPDNVTFWRERLITARGELLWASVSGDFENMMKKDDGGVVVSDQAISLDITSDKSNMIEWIAPSDAALLVGTAGDEHSVTEATTNEVLGPGNVKSKKQTEHGARHVQPVRVGDSVLFAQKSGRKVRDMQYDIAKDGYRAPDTTVLAEHVTKGGLIDMTYQQEPDSVVWGVRADGLLVGFTDNSEQDVHGWHPHRLGGYSDVSKRIFAVVESVVSIPAPDGTRDEVWMIVKRYINGATVRTVEWMERSHEEGDDPEDAFYVDCGLSLSGNAPAAILTPGAGATVKNTANVIFTASAAAFAPTDVGRIIHYRYYLTDVKGSVSWFKGAAAITAYTDNQHVKCTINSAFPDLNNIASGSWRLTVTSITGLNHLEGQTIQLCLDGTAGQDSVVVAGAVALPYAASKVHAGLGCPAVLQPMPIDFGAQDGTALGKTQRISRCGILFHETYGAKYGKDEDQQLDQIFTRGASDNMDEAVPLFTGVKTVSWPSGYDQPALITIVQDQPLPCTVVALLPQLTTQDNR